MNILKLIIPILCFAATVQAARGGGERGGREMNQKGMQRNNATHHDNNNNFRRNAGLNRHSPELDNVEVNPTYVAPQAYPYYPYRPTIQDLEELKGTRE